MQARFHVPDLDPDRPQTELPAGEAHHLTRVLRLVPGAEIAVFDGRGTQYRAEVTVASRDHVLVRLLGPLDAPPVPRVSLTLVQSILKPDAMDGVIRDATMVGVAAIQPVTSERSSLKTAAWPKALDRWRRIAVASAKQCGLARLPDVAGPVPFDRWLGSGQANGAMLLVEPAAASGAISVRALSRGQAPHAAVLVVGPEGGWTAGEYESARTAGCVPLSLGRLTLRAESVPLVAAGALLAVWDE